MFVKFDEDPLNVRIVNVELVTHLEGDDRDALETRVHFAKGGSVLVPGKISEVATRLGLKVVTSAAKTP